MGLLRKTMALSTLGVVNYRSKDERLAVRGRRMSKALEQEAKAAQEQAKAAQQQAKAAREQAKAYGRQVEAATEMAAQRHAAELAELQRRAQWDHAVRYQAWLDQQPMTCTYCETVSAPGTRVCSTCGSRELTNVGVKAPAQRSTPKASTGLSWRRIKESALGLPRSDGS